MFALLLAPVALAYAPDDSLLNPVDAPVEVRLHAEIGLLAPLSHVIQFGQQGTTLDYVTEGGQDNLFPQVRLTTDLYFGKSRRDVVSFVYQPVDLRTEVTLQNDLVVDDTTFSAGTPMDLRYGFSYWRASWARDVIKGEATEFALGLSLQIRNATIDFTSADGATRQSYRNIGPVPVIKLRFRHDFEEPWFIASEVDGFWAPIRYLNGTGSDVEGAIVDWTAQGGRRLNSGVEGFLAARYIAGGAVGTDNTPSSGDGYTRNWLQFFTLSVGLTLR